MDMEQFIEELQAFCKRTGIKVVFWPGGSIVQWNADHAWGGYRDPKSLAALIRDGLGDRIHKELCEAYVPIGNEKAAGRLIKARQASKEYFAGKEGA